MKKKAYLAVLALCLGLALSACGNDSGKQTEDTAQTGKEVTPEAETEEPKEEEPEKKEPSGSGTRLVSVDNVDKYITIGQYKGLSLDSTVEEITDDDVQAQIEQDLQDKAAEVKNTEVQDGDIVTINFVGSKDGVEFEGGTANNYQHTIGAGGMIDGFEEGIIGMRPGETKDLDLTFPEDYQAADLAGQDVVFKITLQSIRRASELTDEWVAKNTEHKTVDEYRAGMKKSLEENAKANADISLKGTAWNTVLTNSEVKEYPQKDIDNAVAEFKAQNEKYANQADMTLEEFVEAQGVSMEYFEEQCQQYAEYKVKQNLIIQGIMDAEGLSLEDQECLDIQDRIIRDYGAQDLAGLIDTYGQVAVDETIGLMRVEDFIVANASVQDMVASGEEAGVDGNEAVEAGEEDNSGSQPEDQEGEIDDDLEDTAE